MKKKSKSYWTRLLKIVRQEWSRNNPVRREIIKKSQISELKPHKWKCASCEGIWALSEIQCDHIVPVKNTIPNSQLEFLESFNRLHSNQLQVLCKSCHAKKTRQDSFDQKHAEAMLRISGALDVSTTFIENALKEWIVIKKFLNIIEKMENAKTVEESTKYLKQMHKLQDKYL